jgi:hypothetical protein
MQLKLPGRHQEHVDPKAGCRRKMIMSYLRKVEMSY